MNHILFIGQGLFLTLELLSASIVIGLSFGILFAVIRYRFKIPGKIIAGFISMIRGTPVILQLSFFYFIIPRVTGLALSPTMCGVITFGINSSAYTSEIFRAGIKSIPKGQFEAAKVLNIPQFFMWRDIILPQVVRNILPALINEIVNLLKETSVISILGGADIMWQARRVSAEEFTFFWPICIAGAYYYIMILLIEKIGRLIEARFAYDKNK